MRKTHLLFKDLLLPMTDAEKELVQKFGPAFDFKAQLQQQLKADDDELTQELQAALQSGALPMKLLEKFLIEKLAARTEPIILLTGFPATAEHYRMLQGVLGQLKIPIECIWHLKTDPAKFLPYYRNSPGQKLWHDKFEDDLCQKVQEAFADRRLALGRLRENITATRWETVELTYHAGAQMFMKQEMTALILGLRKQLYQHAVETLEDQFGDSIGRYERSDFIAAVFLFNQGGIAQEILAGLPGLMASITYRDLQHALVKMKDDELAVYYYAPFLNKIFGIDFNQMAGDLDISLKPSLQYGPDDWSSEYLSDRNISQFELLGHMRCQGAPMLNP